MFRPPPSSSDFIPSRHDWAEHLIWMEGGEPVRNPDKKSVWPGVILTLAIAVSAFSTSSLVSAGGGLADPMLLSMVAGVLAGNLIRSGWLLPGAGWAARILLPTGIVLLGARMDFLEAMRVGLPGLALSVTVVGLSIALMFVIGGRLGVEPKLSCLLGVGTGICGGTAIVAIAPLLRAKERDVMMGVGIVTMAGFAAMLVLPVIAAKMGFSPVQFGMLAGLTIQQTPQAIAAGFAFGEEAGHVATVAKLTRVCLLAPVAAVIAWIVARNPGGGGGAGVRGRWYRFLPKFAIGFLLLAVARTLGLLPEIGLNWESLAGVGSRAAVLDTAVLFKGVASFFLSVGMAGVGYQTRFSHLRGFGWRPTLAMAITILIITVSAVAIIRLLFQ